MLDYEKCCSKCAYSMFDIKHVCTIPSIHICYNRESEHYEEPRAWSETCDRFLSEKQFRKLIELKEKECGCWVVRSPAKYEVDCFTENWVGTKFPENSYSCESVGEVSEIIKNCTRKISGIVKVEVWINHEYEN